MSSDLDVYQQANGIGQYQAGIVMDEKTAKALDEQVRACTKAVLREGTDYGIIPGTGGTKTLWRPGAQKLLQWFGLGCVVDRVEIDTDDDGHRQGVTYRATVTKRLPDGTRETLATCEGYAGYDEDKFYQSAEQVRAKAEDRERMWAKKDGRVANPTKWKGDPERGIPAPAEYRAPWNTVIKRSQKRAIVGATVDATAAGGLFSVEEEDDHSPAPQDDGPSWYEQAIGHALTFTDVDAGRALYVDAAQAHRDGLCTRRQQDHVQNTVRQRVQLIETRAVVDAEDLGRSAAPERPAAAEPDEPRVSGPSAAAGPAEDQPGSASEDQLQSLHIVLGGLGFGSDDREAKLKLAETITGRPLAGGPVTSDASSKNLSYTEARRLIDTLEGFSGDRAKLIAHMATLEQDGDDGA